MRKTSFVIDEYYHIYNRGNSKQKIFHDKEDYFRFMTLLYTCNSSEIFKIFNINRYKEPFMFDRGERLVSIGAYVLMPNHFHVLITEKIEGGITKFIQKLSTAYVMYYNKKYGRTGSLFEGRFKSQYLDTDKYLKYIFSYIHLNPVKLIQKDWKEEGIKNKKAALSYLQNYTYSSFLDFVGEKRKYNAVISLQDFPKYFCDTKNFEREILEWVEYLK